MRFGVVCGACAQRARCTTSRHGRTVQLHADEPLPRTLTEWAAAADGRAELRERVAVEHSLAQIGKWQGDRARYCGVRKNLFSWWLEAAIANFHVAARLTTRLYHSLPDHSLFSEPAL